MHRLHLGKVIRGSLLEGLEMKLETGSQIESIKAGKFVVVEGASYDFFSIITDLHLAATNDALLSNPPNLGSPFLKEIIDGTISYAVVKLRPMLMLKHGSENEELVLEPVKTIPSHFAFVSDANNQDIERVFGSESENAQGKKYFNIGSPLDMEQAVCLDMARFSERSSAVFGRTGTGKTFITRILLAGLIKTDAAVNLVFDMHNEYGSKGTYEGAGASSVKGLHPLFASTGKVKIYSLDPTSTERRGAHCDREVRLSIEQIEPDDILLLQEELRLNPTAAEYSNMLKNKYGKAWMGRFMDMMQHSDSDELETFAKQNHMLSGSLEALYRRLQRLRDMCGFLDFEPHPKKLNIIDDLLNDLSRGISVVIEFGKYDNMMSYLLVANIITRRVEEAYKEKTDVYLRTGNEADKPKQLVITIEEAHKFLNPKAAQQTSFGKIARELRKYYVSLLLVDQRPSGIYDEILSQIGTKVVAALSDERDINGVLTGTSNPGGMRNILASLDSKQQALVLGHAVPMPVVIRPRDYNQAFYTDMGLLGHEEKKKKNNDEINALF